MSTVDCIRVFSVIYIATTVLPFFGYCCTILLYVIRSLDCVWLMGLPYFHCFRLCMVNGLCEYQGFRLCMVNG